MSFARDRFSSSSEKIRKSADVVKRWRLLSGESKQREKNSQEKEESPLLGPKIKGSRSHESVLTSPISMQSIDLSAPGVEVKPLHGSVLGQGHCIHISTSQGSKYISCTTPEERDKWLSSLRRTIKPQEEHSRRSDNSLKFWILEAKNVAPKRRYHCDIILDRTLYAKTSVKTMTDMLFWGEHFEFKNLPAFETITVNLYREADKKKKKDKNMLVGYINLKMTEFENRKLTENWFTCNSGTVSKTGKDVKNELPIIRLKVRRQTVDILPLHLYQTFIEYLRSNYKELCQNFEPVLAVKEKEDLATSLVNILQHQGKACEFLSDIVMEEISRLDDEQLTFRGNSIATKAMEAYMKLVGEKYLRVTLSDLISQLIQSPDDCEVDPTKVASPQLLACQQKNLDMYSNMVWVKVTNSFCYFPNELREVFASIHSRCTEQGKGDYAYNLISSCIFLRFLCPAILYPSLFRLTQEYPDERTSRNLTLIAKTIQTLANFTQFGIKEEFMTFMNAFVEKEAPNTRTFLHRISSQEVGNQFLQFDEHIDLGKELSVLHALLLEYSGKYSQAKEFEKLNEIISSLSNALDDPSVGQEQPMRKSQMYDNLIPCPRQSAELLQPPDILSSTPAQEKNLTVSSPTQVLIDMLHHCMEMSDDLPTLPDQTRASISPGQLSIQTGDDSTNNSTAIRKISVIGPYQVYNEQKLPASWSYTASDADNMNDDYVDLIPFMVNEAENSPLKQDSTNTGTQRLQPLAFANPLFGHQLNLQQARKNEGHVVYPDMYSGIHVSEAKTVRRVSSDSSISSESEKEDSVIKSQKAKFALSDDSSSQKAKFALSDDSSSQKAKFALSDDSSSITSLKTLSHLLNSSSGESLNGELGSKSTLHTHYIQSASANFSSPSQSVKVTSSALSFTSNIVVDGCSTFPRKQRTRSDINPPIQPWKAKNIFSERVESSISLSGKVPSFHRRLSSPSDGSTQTFSERFHTASSDKFEINSNSATSIISSKFTTGSDNYKMKTSSSALTSAHWQIANYVERSSSSQEVSSSSDSSPKSLLCSSDHGMSSMHESSSAHSFISVPSTSQPWSNTSSNSDSNSSVNSLSKIYQKTSVKNDSSRASNMINVSKTYQSSSASSFVASGNNNSSGFCNTNLSAQENIKSGCTSHSCSTSHSVDLGHLYKRGEMINSDGLSNTGSCPKKSLTDDEGTGMVASAIKSATNRRHSAHSAIHLGISSVQRKLQEQERTKQEFEQEVYVLRQQLLEAQERLQQTELRLLDHEIDTQKLMDEWQYRLVESEEKIRKQQAEKDEQMKNIISRLHTIEEELKKEHAEMVTAVEHKQQVIELQEQRIQNLDDANNKLIQALADLRTRAEGAAVDQNSNSSSCGRVVQNHRVVGLRTSSC